MGEARVTRTLDVTPDALWRCVRAFGVVPWIPGGENAEIRGEGVGQVRIFSQPNGKIREVLTGLDDAARTITYTIPDGIPFPVTRYESAMAVSDDAGRGRLTWSCRFDPEPGASAADVAKGIEGAYGLMMGWIEAHLRRAD